MPLHLCRFVSLLALVCPAFAQVDSVPFTTPSGTGEAMHFTPIRPALSGVNLDNPFNDAKMWWDRYLEFSVGAIGNGLAIGDYDNDGRPDLFLTSKTGPCRLYRNLGEWRFADVTPAAGLAATDVAPPAPRAGLFGRTQDLPVEGRDDIPGWNNGAAWADLNNDGHLDLLLCRFNLPNQLWINQGDGTFVERAQAAGLDLVDASGMAAIADYDRDGWLDVFIQTNLFNAATAPSGQPDRLYRNNRDGTFTETTTAAGISGLTQGHSALWWDYDQDGWIDLYVANDFSAPDQLWHNQRDGTFVNRLETTVPHTPFSAMGGDLGDINNDGRIDLFVADMAATTWAKDQRGMADSRAKIDPASDAVPTPQVLRNVLYLNTGTTRMAEAANLAGLAATDWTWSPRFEDLDNDGWLDLHITNGMVRELHNADIIARTMIAESPAERIRLTRDSPLFAEANLMYQNRGDMTFAEVGAAWGLDQPGVSFASAFGDLDGDGDLDLVYANYRGPFSLLRNDSPTGGRVTFALRGTSSNRFGIGATIEIETAAGRQIRPLTLARGYMATSQPIAHFGLGQIAQIDRVTIRWPSGRVQVLTDLPAGRAYTIVEPETDSDPSAPSPSSPRYRDRAAPLALAVTVPAPAVNETARQTLLPFRHHRTTPRLAVGDFNHDQRPDLVLGGSTETSARVFFGTATGYQSLALVAPQHARAETNDGAVLVWDADADGDDDILLTKGGAVLPDGNDAYQPQLWLNTGRGFAPGSDLPPWHHSTATAITADFDRDGRPDVFLAARLLVGAYPSPAPTTIWFGAPLRPAPRPDVDASWQHRPAMVAAACAVDADGDGWTDLVTVEDWGETVIWFNRQGRAFEPIALGEGQVRGWWRSIASGDFNEDGRPDFVVGNAGLNTVYRPPAVLYAGNFGGRRGPSLIEAIVEDGLEKPRTSLKVLSSDLPHLARRHRSFDDYATTSLADLLGADKLARAIRYEANELRSGVWLSQADGSWTFVALDAVAQLAPIVSIAVGDADGDGHADLFLGQNDHAPVPRIGRFEGGLGGLWRGDGNGGFHFIDWAQSGVVVPGAVKDVLALDVDGNGTVEWIVSRENDAVMVWQQP